MDNLPSIEALEAAHSFPGQFTIKLFSKSSTTFSQRVRAVVLQVTGVAGDPRLSTRSSSKGRHLCVTLEVVAASAAQVRELYRELGRLEELSLMF